MWLGRCRINDMADRFFNHLKAHDIDVDAPAAGGGDGVTWHEYERNVEANMADLHDRIHRGAYRAQPSRRAWIPKSNGRQRPLGIASLEAKIVQQAVLYPTACRQLESRRVGLYEGRL